MASNAGTLIGDTLTLYTIYDHPRDYPDHVVVRWHWVEDGRIVTGPGCCWVCDSVGQARSALRRQGLTSLGRHPKDDATIVETWI